MKTLFLLLFSVYFTACSSLDKKDITYSTKKTNMKGHIVYDKSVKQKRPGILVVHEWWGHNKHARKSAKKLAKLGYVALAVDMYGDGKTASHPKDAKKFAMMTLSNTKEAEARFQAAIDTLKDHPMVDKEKIAAIGYCFGGGVVLHAARKGFDLDAVVSFHGSLTTKNKMRRGKYKGKVLVLNGADDPMVTKKHIKNFEKEMKKAKVDYKFVDYPGAVHAFTNPDATKKGKKFNLPLAYDEKADKASWNEMKNLFADIFK